MKGFANALAYIRGRGIVRADIAVQDGKIVKISPPSHSVEPLAKTGDFLLTAGFIDEHIHGAGGADSMDGGPRALSEMTSTLLN